MARPSLKQIRLESPLVWRDLWRVFILPIGLWLQVFVPSGGEWWDACYQGRRFLRESVSGCHEAWAGLPLCWEPIRMKRPPRFPESFPPS